MEIEIWKPIKGFEESYQISNFGNIISNERKIVTINGVERIYKERRLKLKPHRKRGYIGVRLYQNDGTYLQVEVHRLVAMHFIENPKGLPIVNHINTIRSDNHVSNLEWVTYSENILHKGAHLKGREKIKKKVFQYTLDGKLIGSFSSATDAMCYGYDRSGISQVCNGHMPHYLGYIWSFTDSIGGVQI